MPEFRCLHSGSKCCQTTSRCTVVGYIVQVRELAGEHISLLQSSCLTPSHAGGKERRGVKKDAKQRMQRWSAEELSWDLFRSSKYSWSTCKTWHPNGPDESLAAFSYGRTMP